MASVEIYNKSSTGFSVKLTGLQDVTYTRKCEWTVYQISSGNNVASGTAYIEGGLLEGGYYTFSGMSPNTQYQASCRVSRTDTGEYLTTVSSDKFYTDSSGSGGGGSGGGDNESEDTDIPEYALNKWSWNKSNVNASQEQTAAARIAIVDKTEVRNFSYIVWNDLVDKVDAVIRYKGEVWISIYDTYEKTRMTYNDRTLTAKRFNSLRYNLGARYSTGINEVKSGDKVLGSYFNTLVSKLNEWIETLW